MHDNPTIIQHSTRIEEGGKTFYVGYSPDGSELRLEVGDVIDLTDVLDKDLVRAYELAELQSDAISVDTLKTFAKFTADSREELPAIHCLAMIQTARSSVEAMRNELELGCLRALGLSANFNIITDKGRVLVEIKDSDRSPVSWEGLAKGLGYSGIIESNLAAPYWLTPAAPGDVDISIEPGYVARLEISPWDYEDVWSFLTPNDKPFHVGKDMRLCPELTRPAVLCVSAGRVGVVFNSDVMVEELTPDIIESTLAKNEDTYQVGVLAVPNEDGFDVTLQSKDRLLKYTVNGDDLKITESTATA